MENQTLNNQTLNNHNVTIDNRKRVTMTGVIAVESFNEKQVQARLKECGVLVLGESLNVSKFNTENGTLAVDGQINEIKYTQTGMKATGLIKKLFK